MSDNQEVSNSNSLLKSINRRKIIAPILIGFGAVAYLFWDEFDVNAFDKVTFTKMSVLWIFCAVCMMMLRDLGYILRIKILSGNQMTWRQCIRVIFLWEFTSAVTPSAVGGTSIAVLFLYKEKVPIGQSTAIVMATAFLDELYFLLMFPLLLVVVNSTALFSITSSSFNGVNWSNEFFYFAVIGYSLKAAFTFLVFYGLFINPRGVKWLIAKIFTLRFLKRWRRSAIKTGNDIMLASKEFKSKPFSFWVKVFATTFLSWTARYWVVNFLFIAFFVVPDHIIIFARQLVMWIMMLVSPTPGGSGFSEFIFSEFLGESIPVVTLIPVLAILWRFISYYPYLIIGAFLVPTWIKQKFSTEE
jgi:uncharacterized protein (TIRG00374 family)